MRSTLAKDFQKKFGRAVGNHVRLRKIRRAVHQHQQLNDPFYFVQVPEGELQRGEQFYGNAACGLFALECGNLLPTLPDQGLPSFFATRPDK